MRSNCRKNERADHIHSISPHAQTHINSPGSAAGCQSAGMYALANEKVTAKSSSPYDLFECTQWRLISSYSAGFARILVYEACARACVAEWKWVTAQRYGRCCESARPNEAIGFPAQLWQIGAPTRVVCMIMDGFKQYNCNQFIRSLFIMALTCSGNIVGL